MSTNFKRFLLIMLSILLLITSFQNIIKANPDLIRPAPQAIKLQDIRIEVSDKLQNYIKSTVFIMSIKEDGTQSGGTAVALFDNLFITNSHVVGKEDQCTLVKNPGRKEAFDCEVVYENKDTDLSLLKVKDFYISENTVSMCDFVSINFTKDYFNYAFDSHLSRSEEELIFSIQTTKMTSSNKYIMLFFNHIGVPGRSGSGVFDEQNNCVIGLTSIGYTYTNTGGAISNIVVNNFIKEYNRSLTINT